MVRWARGCRIVPAHKKPRRDCRQCGSAVKRPSSRFCNNHCQQEFQYAEYIRRWLSGEETGNRSGTQVSRHVRRYLFEQHESKCQECGWGSRNPVTGLVPLTVEHIDGNWLDSRLENLQLLCPNCHSLTPTYGALNQNGRHSWLRQRDDSKV